VAYEYLFLRSVEDVQESAKSGWRVHTCLARDRVLMERGGATAEPEVAGKSLFTQRESTLLQGLLTRAKAWDEAGVLTAELRDIGQKVSGLTQS
jgi:hypothetical protein